MMDFLKDVFQNIFNIFMFLIVMNVLFRQSLQPNVDRKINRFELIAAGCVCVISLIVMYCF